MTSSAPIFGVSATADRDPVDNRREKNRADFMYILLDGSMFG
jgi:hypothetical protein